MHWIDHEPPPGSVRAKVFDTNVVAFVPQEDGRCRVWECCDGFYYHDLTADELRTLAKELEAIADGLG